MGNLKGEAEAYVQKQTKNITELAKVSVELDTREEEFTDAEGKPFAIMKVTVDGEDYRVPKSVLKQLKEILEEMPDLKFFKVKSSGTGLNTEYTTIPLVE